MMNDSGWRLSVKCHAGLTYYGLGTEHWRQHIKHLLDILPHLTVNFLVPLKSLGAPGNLKTDPAGVDPTGA
jgi:hypothetical protein